MPELPEVETVRIALHKNILHHKIVDVEIHLPKMVETDTEFFIRKLINNAFTNIDRKGKWLIMELNNGVILSHLRMEGKYYYKDTNEIKAKHEHVIIKFDNGMSLRYNDTRQFGKMKWFDTKEACLIYLKDRLGEEPWDIDKAWFYNKLQRKTIAIKTAILDQKLISGIGNIYADEILFLSKINPMLPANKLTKNQTYRLVDNASKVLQDSIKMGGTTIRNYESEQGVTGHYQNELLVHTKVGKPCINCNNLIIKTKVNGRGTYYCPHCQK